MDVLLFGKHEARGIDEAFIFITLLHLFYFTFILARIFRRATHAQGGANLKNGGMKKMSV